MVRDSACRRWMVSNGASIGEISDYSVPTERARTTIVRMLVTLLRPLRRDLLGYDGYRVASRAPRVGGARQGRAIDP